MKGFPQNGPFSAFFVGIPTRFGNGKLAQEGTAFARKRNAANFLAAPALYSRAARLHVAQRQPYCPTPSARQRSTTGFPLTALKLSRRIIKGMSGGLRLKPNDCPNLRVKSLRHGSGPLAASDQVSISNRWLD